MRTVMPDLLSQTLAWRKQTGNDKFDEMWEGVSHMTPAPKRSHQDFQWDYGDVAAISLGTTAGKSRASRCERCIRRAAGPTISAFPISCCSRPTALPSTTTPISRVPRPSSWKFAAPATRRWRSCRSMRDLGVPEVWLIDRDTRRPEVLVLAGRPVSSSNRRRRMAGSIVPPRASNLRGEAGNCLAMQLAGDEATRQLLPEA